MSCSHHRWSLYIDVLYTSGMVLYFTYGIRHSKLNEKAYHSLPLHTVEEENVNLLADGPSEDSLINDNL